MPLTSLFTVLALVVLMSMFGFIYAIRQNDNVFHFSWKVFTAGGGWFPFFVFTSHLFLSQVLHLYDLWPPTDVPMHFMGGVAIAFFVSRCFQLLPRQSVKRSRVLLLELLLMGSLTATAAVFWEFAEFSIDQLFGTNVQLGLANTIQDMAMGILGSILIILIRFRQLQLGKSELREITFDWIRGEA